MATEILVFVPGILGSELKLGKDVIWPGGVKEAIKGFDEERFQKLMALDLEPGDIIRSAAGGLVSIYDIWIRAFESIVRGGKLFREKAFGDLPKTLYVFPYDWRRDLRDTAALLATFIDTISHEFKNPDISLVCHSMGGVVARY